MIITCINCDKKFNVNSELIPSTGRTIQCGSCNHIWFFKVNSQENEDFKKTSIKDDSTFITKKESPKKKFHPDPKVNALKNFENNTNKKGSEIIKYDPKINFTFAKFLSYILVLIISLMGLIIILDTFKSSLYNLFPNLEFFLYSLYETLKDIELFIKDLF